MEDGKRLRVDTTVVETDIRFPSDSSLLWDCVRVITREVKRLGKNAPEAVRDFRDHTRKARRRFQQITRMTRQQRHQQQRPKYRDLIETTEHVVGTARVVLPKARMKAESCDDLVKGIRIRGQCDSIERYCALADRVIDQARRRVLKDEQVSHDFTKPAIADALSNFLRPHLAEIVHRAARGASDGDKA